MVLEMLNTFTLDYMHCMFGVYHLKEEPFLRGDK
jgi:hypothetical protein